MTVAGACGAEERPESSARPARAGLSNPFRFLFPARRPRLGVRGSLAAALVLLALSVLAPAGPVHAQEIAVQVSGEGISTRDMTWRGTWSGAGFGDAVWDPPANSAVSGTRTRTFTIRNAGTAPLKLTGTPTVSITGRSAQDFTVVQQPAATVAPGSTTTFDVVFNPSSRGNRVARISIPNNDHRTRRWSAVDPFIFTISGYALDPVTLTVGAGPMRMAGWR